LETEAIVIRDTGKNVQPGKIKSQRHIFPNGEMVKRVVSAQRTRQSPTKKEKTKHSNKKKEGGGAPRRMLRRHFHSCIGNGGQKESWLWTSERDRQGPYTTGGGRPI